MKCLSIMQPWATLLAHGKKQYETRTWQTSYRGPIGIHASRTMKGGERILCSTEPFKSLLQECGYSSWEELPTGMLIARAEIIDCQLVDHLEATPLEKKLGHWFSGHYAFKIANPTLLVSPLEVKGLLGIFEIDYE